MEGTVTVTIWDELSEIFANGGFVMPPLAVLGLLLWLGIGYRAMTLRRGSSAGVRSLVSSALEGSLETTRGYVDQAADLAVRLRKSLRGNIKRILDEELFFLDERLGRYRTLVRTIVAVAPLAGLLGTVAGMIEMFSSLGTQTFYSQSGGVANGISQALLTTQFGLMIAIPGLIVGRLLDRHENRLRDEIEQIKELVSHENMPAEERTA
jgi:biopolymer transport protein ExbB